MTCEYQSGGLARAAERRDEQVLDRFARQQLAVQSCVQTPFRGQRRIQRPLHALLPIPLGLAVADQVQQFHSILPKEFDDESA